MKIVIKLTADELQDAVRLYVKDVKKLPIPEEYNCWKIFNSSERDHHVAVEFTETMQS